MEEFDDRKLTSQNTFWLNYLFDQDNW
jgi:hypothetical protein